MFISVTRQLKRAVSAVKSVLAVAGTAAAALDPKLKSFLAEGETVDGIEPLMITLVRWIQGDHDRLEEHEARQLRALRQLKKLRLLRDRRQETLYARLLRIRKTFEDAFGGGTAAVYLGLEPRLSDLEAVVLRRLARETVKILTDPGLETPPAVVEGLWDSPVHYAEQILEALEPFEATLDAIEDQKREVEKAQKAKIDLLTELGERLTWSIRLFEAIYRLADLGFHADRLRLKLGSRPSADETAEASGGEGPEPGGEEPAEESADSSTSTSAAPDAASDA